MTRNHEKRIQQCSVPIKFPLLRQVLLDRVHEFIPVNLLHFFLNKILTAPASWSCSAVIVNIWKPPPSTSSLTHIPASSTQVL